MIENLDVTIAEIVAVLTTGLYIKQKTTNFKSENIKFTAETNLIGTLNSNLNETSKKVTFLTDSIDNLKDVLRDKDKSIQKQQIVIDELEKEVKSMEAEISLLIDLVNRLSD